MMNRNVLLWISGILMIGMVSCGESGSEGDNKVDDTEVESKLITTESGLQYEIIQEGSGQQAKSGDLVEVHYTGTLKDGTKFDSSVDRGQPFSFPLGQGRVIPGWDEGIALLKVGTKAKLYIPSNLGYGARAAGKIPANSDLIFEVELLDIKEPVTQWDVSSLKAKTTQSGLKYYMLEERGGDKPTAGQTVFVHYTGFLEDGTKFDSSVERGQPISFPLGQGQVIKGWDEGIALLSKGEKAKFVIPSSLGYGEKGAGGVIPPNATLHFDVELVDFK
jgi:peptidylprolyl isomerase